MTDRLPLPSPIDYCYEWDGLYGTRKFSAAPYNGAPPARSMPIYTADQMHQYADAECAVLTDEIEALRKDRSAITQRVLEAAANILSEYQIPVGNSRAGELACEWTYDALKECRDEIRRLEFTYE